MISPEMRDEARNATGRCIHAVQTAPHRAVRAPVVAVALLCFASAALAWRTGLPAGGILLVQVPAPRRASAACAERSESRHLGIGAAGFLHTPAALKRKPKARDR
jgi:hypothetical protein